MTFEQPPRNGSGTTSEKFWQSVESWIRARNRDLNIATGILLAGLAGYVYFHNSKEVHCLAQNIIHEAQFEPKKGQEAVALVTVLRALSGKYPESVCGVVFQTEHGRQFSWTGNKALVAEDIGARLTHQIAEIAENVFDLKDNPNALAKKVAELGLTQDTYFYKRFDWVGEKLTEKTKWFFEQCLEPLRDTSGNPLQIGAHVFYRPRLEYCPPPQKIPPLPERNPVRS